MVSHIAHTQRGVLGCSSVLTQPSCRIVQTKGKSFVREPQIFHNVERKWGIRENESEPGDMNVGILAGGLRRRRDIQQYSLSWMSFVPSGAGLCLEKHL